VTRACRVGPQVRTVLRWPPAIITAKIHSVIRPIVKHALLASGVAATLLLSACGPSAKTPSSDGTAAAAGGGGAGGAGAKKTCAVAPASLINSALGRTVGDPEEQDNGTVTVCTYTGGGTTIVRFDTATDAGSFATEKQGFAPQGMQTVDISGFGDEAYSAVLSAAGITTNTVVVRKGSVEVLVTSSASIDQEKALAQKLLDVL
jgi:hypothetical protein